MDVEAMAKESAGNWRKFSAFAWSTAKYIDDADQWAIFYTHNRDSKLLELSNADAINETMKPFEDPDVPNCNGDIDDVDAIQERHNHWACGWVEGWCIRVYNKTGEISEAFKKYCEIMEALADYPVIDEEDYSRREYEATLENIRQVARYAANSFDEDVQYPEEYEQKLFSWLWANDQRELDNNDGDGGYPSEESVGRAMMALGWVKENQEEEETAQ